METVRLCLQCAPAPPPQSSLFRNGNFGAVPGMASHRRLNLPYLGMETTSPHFSAGGARTLKFPSLGMETGPIWSA